jgi:hypothetical protein
MYDLDLKFGVCLNKIMHIKIFLKTALFLKGIVFKKSGDVSWFILVERLYYILCLLCEFCLKHACNLQRDSSFLPIELCMHYHFQAWNLQNFIVSFLSFFIG